MCACTEFEQAVSDSDEMPVRMDVVRERLKEARRASGFASAKAAAAADGFPVPLDTLLSWESRGTEPGIMRLSNVCEFYGVSLAWVTGQTDDPSGLPVKQTIVDMDAVARIDAATSLQEIEDMAQRCPKCGNVEVTIAFEFPKHFATKSALEFGPIFSRASAKLDKLKKG